ncbi:MAG: FG-GAP-like repeat-containing protein [Bryobacteraceae bacterium]
MFASAALGLGPNAHGAQLNPGDTLEIRFTTTATVCPSGTCDVLIGYVNEAGAYNAVNITAKLFNGNSLLGTYTNLSCCVPYFRSATSLFQDGSTTVDFTAINAGTIQGLLQISIASGYLTWPSAPASNLTIGHATAPGVVAGGTGIQVQSITIVSAPPPWPTPTSTSFIAAPDPVTFGTPIVLNAIVNATSATGKMTFYDGTKVLGTAPVSADHAALQVALDATGARRLYAHYSGDANFAPSTSGYFIQNVRSVPAFAFGSGTSPVGFYALGVAAGDFNGDGKADLLAVGPSNAIAVVLGNGNGTFGAPITTMAPAAPNYNFPAVADFDGDGKLDVAVAAGDNTVKILFGNGDGTFGGAVTLATAAGPISIADLNGDGVPDLVVAHGNGGSVGIVLGNGDRTFHLLGESGAGLQPEFIAVGDLNGDGKPDLLVVPPYSLNGSRFITVILGNGDGTFAPAVSYPANLGELTGVDLFALEDMNGDGKLDLVTATGFGDSIYVLLGNGDGTFAPAASYSSQSMYEGSALGLAVVDVDGDGSKDVVVGRTSGGAYFLEIFYGNGDGTLPPPEIETVPVAFSYLIPADFDGSGRVDFGSADSANPSIQVFTGALAPSLRVALTHTGSFMQGQSGTITMTVRNAAGAAATNGNVTVLPHLCAALSLLVQARAQ